LFPSESGKVISFVFKDINTSEIREVTMTAQTITGQAVSNIKTFANGEVGYFQFNRHNAVAEKPLYDAFNDLAASNVKDLIIDMRYNP
ncbi:S41 family peptidase, partial [Limimaricola sp. G21655-S1]|nr:S41 family peptidase [Limimaricola sp. G21655-S1]